MNALSYSPKETFHACLTYDSTTLAQLEKYQESILSFLVSGGTFTHLVDGFMLLID